MRQCSREYYVTPVRGYVPDPMHMGIYIYSDQFRIIYVQEY